MQTEDKKYKVFRTIRKPEDKTYKIMHFVLLVVILFLFSKLSIDAIIFGAACIYLIQTRGKNRG